MERIARVCICRSSTAGQRVDGEFVSRPHDRIEVHVHDMRLFKDIACDRDIRLAYRLAKSHGADFDIEPEYEERVRNALGDLIHSHPISIR